MELPSVEREIKELRAKYAAEIRSLTDWIEALDAQLKFEKEQLKETNKNWTDTITYYEKRLKGARKMVLDLRKKTPKSLAKGTLFLISELLRSEQNQHSPVVNKESINGDSKK
jgi:predicted  nucleic acid-binding Zn-ribbon protein